MRFLADEQIPLIFTRKLRLLDFDIIEVKSIPELQAADDVDVVLRYAKARQRVLLSADNMADRSTRDRLQENLRRTRRGKVLTIRGGPEQGWFSFVGKLIYHAERWQGFFDEGHGWFIIGDLKPDTARGRRPHELPRRTKVKVTQGAKYVDAMAAKSLGPKNPNMSHPKGKPPTAGARLPEAPAARA